jgi:hypothetical protein
MKKYLLNSDQLQQLLEKTIDLFQEYQYKHGYEEPVARSRAVADILVSIEALRNRPASKSE